ITALSYLGNDVDRQGIFLKDYDHHRLGPFLGVSDDSHSGDEICQALVLEVRGRVVSQLGRAEDQTEWRMEMKSMFTRRKAIGLFRLMALTAPFKFSPIAAQPQATTNTPGVRPLSQDGRPPWSTMTRSIRSIFSGPVSSAFSGAFHPCN